MSLHFIIIFWLSLFFLVCGIALLITYKNKKSQQAKESLLGATFMLILLGVVGILCSIIFG
ncbi:hypothetical protein M4L39_06515 [Staphylococcus equorum]|uniref:Uncharacterized protein n=1 Tax=Staphylococcus equorum TaxID=246432 RepID=A0A9X4R1K4_9STAP|nr:hypothetical protein [Staphylococcus equorum]MDG0843089.1 hypothetical protein [Staphylococcus equorum]MDG0858959.1 hypothetical protein [Staphylococcus equorum]